MAKTKPTSKPAKQATAKRAAKKAAKAARPAAKRPMRPAAKKPVKEAPAARKTKPAKPARKSKPTQKRKPPQPPAVPQQVLSGDSLANLAAELGDALGDVDEVGPTMTDVGGRDAIHVELGAKLAAMRGDEQQERAAIAAAIDSYMQCAISDGLAPDASAYAARCPDFFWEGDGTNPPVYARVPDATHDEIGRWFQLIVEGVRAYDARVGASPSN
jgi:hypothetical protein